jgi:hypothetical protein
MDLNTDSRKASGIVIASIAGIASIAIFVALVAPSVDHSALAQAQKSSNAITVNQTAAAKAMNNFTASGKIGDTVSMSGMSMSAMSSNSSSSSAASPQCILTGDWSLTVSKGNVTNFKANFVMAKIDGSSYHTHNVTSFRVGNNTNFSLNPSGMSTINGSSDVYVNGTLKWPGVHTTLSINKLLIMSLNLSSSDTSNHFTQPIYGTVATLTSQNGTQIVGPSSSTATTSTSSSGGGGIGGMLGNITKPFQNLFGGGGKK